MKLPRRRFLHLAVGSAALPAGSRLVWAQAYPARSVRIIVGQAAGSGTDIAARLLGQWLSERLGRSFVVENRPGAAGNMATEAVARSPADGYTLLFICHSSNAINATLYDKLSFVFLRDIVPVAGILRAPLVLEVHPSVPTNTVPEFIAYAKSNPGKLNMASAGIGSVHHLTGELFKFMTGVDVVHVPYRGTTPALSDLLAGQVQAMFNSTPSSTRTSGRASCVRWRYHGDPLGRVTGHPDRKRFRAGLRGERMARFRRAEGYARCDHRNAQP